MINNYLNLLRNFKKYRVNLKDIKKLYRLEKTHIPPPAYEPNKSRTRSMADTEIDDPFTLSKNDES